MPKKIDYREELEKLTDLSDTTLQPVTARVSVACLRKLYRLCDRDGLDLSALVRQILEEQAGLYLEAKTGAATRPGTGASCVLHLPAEVRDLANKACEGLALDLPTLLQLMVTEALPGWVLRSSKALRQRQQALAHLENRLTPEKAVWAAYCRLVPLEYAPALQQVGTLVEEGTIQLELEGDASLYLIFPAEEIEASESSLSMVATASWQELVRAGVLVQDEAGQRWRVELQTFLVQRSKPAIVPPPREKRKRVLDLGPSPEQE